jgi:hypothetical protein
MVRTLAGLWVAAITIAGCVTIDVSVDHDPEVDFSKYHTFAQAPPPSRIENLPGYNEVRGRQIQHLIATELEAKGYRKVDPDDADLLVAFTVSGEPRTDIWVEESGTAWGSGGRPGRAGRYGSYDRRGTMSTTEYISGALAIDIYDNALRRQVWHGLATADVYTSSEGQKTGDKAVQKLLSRFPPGQE